MVHRASRLEAAIEAVRLACRITRTMQGSLASMPRMAKDDASPVTAADLAAQAVIAHTLEKRLGRATIVAEEDASTLRRGAGAGQPDLGQSVLGAVRDAWPGATLDEVAAAIDLGAADPPTDSLHGFWTLDPIDGTKGFLRGGQYSVCLAWIENGAPVLGIVGCPNLSKDLGRPLDEPDEHGTIYFASAGEGLWELSASEENEQPLRVLPLMPYENEPLRLVESFDSASGDGSEAELVLERVGELAEPLHIDGQVKYAVVARGQGDVYLRLPRRNGWVERIWDHAPGALLVIESGGAVTDAAGAGLDFSRGRGLERNRGILAARPVLHGRVLAAIESLGLAR